MPIYDIDISFNLNVSVESKPVFNTLNGFTHVLKRPVQFLNSVGGVWEWKNLGDIKTAIKGDHSVVGEFFVADVDETTIIEDTSVPNGPPVGTLSFTDFTTGDLVETMYTEASWADAVTGITGAKKQVNDSLDSFTDEVYDKLKNNFNIDNGLSVDEGFGYLATRKVATASAKDPLDPEDTDRILALVVYQSSTQGSGSL